MPRFEWLDPQCIEPPSDAMRHTSFMDGMGDFLADIAKRGVKSPIGVRDLTTGFYEVIWGARRTYAARETGQALIPAMVYGLDEENTDELMAVENLQRTQVNAAEEAEMYHRLIDRRGMTIAGVSAQLNVPASRVHKLLGIREGDPEVLQMLSEGRLSIAQAEAINNFTDEIGRAQALHYAVQNGTSALMLQNWQRERVNSGLDVSMEALAEQLTDGSIPDYRNQAKCVACEQWKNLTEVTHRVICEEDWELIAHLLSAYRAQLAIVDTDDQEEVQNEVSREQHQPTAEYDAYRFGRNGK